MNLFFDFDVVKLLFKNNGGEGGGGGNRGPNFVIFVVSSTLNVDR